MRHLSLSLGSLRLALCSIFLLCSGPTQAGQLAPRVPPIAPADVPATEATTGSVAIVAGSFAFDEPTARALCPDPKLRLRITIGIPAESSIDVLAALGSPTPACAIDVAAPYPGDSRELAHRVRAARCLVLEGGTWLQWWRLLKPDDKLTGLGQAVIAAHASGATVIGVNAAGLYLARWSLLSRVALGRPSRDPHDTSLDVLMEGFGLVHGACFDMELDGRDSPERLIGVVSASGVDAAIWLAGPCAWIQVDDGRAAHLCAPAGAAYLFDLARAVHSREAVCGGVLATLVQGDRFDARTRAVTSASGPIGSESLRDGTTATWRSHLASVPAPIAWNSRTECTLVGERSVLTLRPAHPLAGSREGAGGAPARRFAFDCAPIER